MFERFTDEARDVVRRAQREARSLGHPSIGSEHLLLALAAQPQTAAHAVLGTFGITAERFRAAIVDRIGSGGQFGASGADALRALGIDLDEVRRRIEERFGAGALDAPVRPRRRARIQWRRTRDGEQRGGAIPFTPHAKQVLELALREALALKDRHLGPEHILLGILRMKDNTGKELLRHLGVAPEAVRAQLLANLRRAA